MIQYYNYGSRFGAQNAIDIYNTITGHGTYNSPYFSPENVPYYSVETLIVDAPYVDYGHESMSDTFSYWVWLEAVHGKLTGDYDGVDKAWDNIEKHLIPDSKNQPGNSKYNPSSPATYVPEQGDIEDYPSPYIFQSNIVGRDPLAKELQQAYGTWDMYAMHWIIDGDNWYGYGQQGDGVSKPSFIDTFKRGPSESIWQTVPHPCWESMKWGGRNGFLDLFTLDNSYAKQWSYTASPNADARAIQAAYFAYIWAQEDGISLSHIASKAAKLGDYLRYAQYDKYFKNVGVCVGYNKCKAGTGKESAHYLISWYFSWGGGLQGDWTWRVGSSHVHSGYQNPLTAWILSTQNAFKPRSSSGARDWATSLDRQLELLRWLQSPEGVIAGGATNSWNGAYELPPDDIPTFYGMFYDWQPVYHDQPSNNWIGMQGWSMERVCSLYYLTGNEKAGTICSNWIHWVKMNVRVSGGDIVHALELAWEGLPDEWNRNNFNKDGLNRSLHGIVSYIGLDTGVIASMMTSLLWYSAKTNDEEGYRLFADVMDALENYKDEIGYTVYEECSTYDNFYEEVYIPAGWVGKNAQGATIKSGVSFLDIRPKYKEDEAFSDVEDFYNGGFSPMPTYHRFRALSEIMIANGISCILENSKRIEPEPEPEPEPVQCSKTILSYGYKCCNSGCKVVYSNEDGNWGYENHQWCGCEVEKRECSSRITQQGYYCCSQCGKVYYVDEDGDWGFEDGNWCGMPLDC